MGAPNQIEAETLCPRCGERVAGSWQVCAWCGTALVSPTELPAGAELEDRRYEILGLLGRGGFGITYRARDRRLQRTVAVKELFPEKATRHARAVHGPPEARDAFADARTRFLNEALVLARFSHPGIVRVYEVFEENNTAYLVMELLEGPTLAGLLRDRGRPFEEADVLEAARRISAALRTVHGAGVLHRDLNPTNVIVTGGTRMVLIDFGIARVIEPGTQSLTQIVTPGYAPPEQYAGAGRLGPATDVYGLAATLYRLLTDHKPLPAIDRQGGAPLPPPRRLVAGVSKATSDAVMDGLELNPDHRPQTIDAFSARLGLQRGISAGGSSSPFGAEAHRPAAAAATPERASASAPAASPAAAAGVPASNIPPAPVGPGPEAGTELATAAGPLARAAAAPARPAGPVPTSAPVPAAATPYPPPAGMSAPAAAAPPMAYPPSAYFPSPAAYGAPAGVVGPHRAGRWKVTVPLAVLALAVTSAAPVVVAVALVLVVLPALATVGDVRVRRQRRQQGVAAGRFANATDTVAAPARFVANLATSAVRSVPALALDAVLVGAWLLATETDLSRSVTDLILRGAGLLAAGILVYPLGQGRRRFRTDAGIDRIAEEVVDDAGRLYLQGYVLWLVCVGLAAFALWLAPDAWPFTTG